MTRLAICKAIKEDMPDFSAANKKNNIDDSLNENEETFIKDETLCIDSNQNQIEKSYINHRLIALSGTATNKAYIINLPKMLIGRDQRAHIRVDEKSVSSCHAMICVKDKECTIKDLNSRNGTIVNGCSLKNSLKLKDGDKIRIGSLLFIFASGNLGHSFWPVEHSWKNIIIKGLAITGIIVLAILVAIIRITSSPQTASSAKMENSNAKSIQTGTNQQVESSSQNEQEEQSISPDVEGLQLAEKALRSYVNGDITLSVELLEKTSQLNLSDSSPLKAKVLTIRAKIMKIHDLYHEGLRQYQKKNINQAIETWSEALRADREIVGQESSYFAGEIANYTGNIFHQMALQAYKNGDIKQAQEICSQAFRAQPNNEGCHKIMNAIPAAKNVSLN